MQMQRKESRVGYNYIRQNRLSQNCQKKQRIFLYNNEEINSTRAFKNCKYTFTQHQRILIYKAGINSSEPKLHRNSIIEGNFNCPFSTTK